MRKIVSIALAVMMFAFVLTGCAKAKDAAANAVPNAATTESTAQGSSAPAAGKNDNASEFVNAYLEAKSAALTRLMDGLSNNQDTMMNAFSFLGISMSDLYLLPAMYFGLGETSVSTALAMMGAKDVTYDEQGNTYTITYQNADEKVAKMIGTYDKGRSLTTVGSTDGTENNFFEVYRTSFGYVSQYYFISDDGVGTVYQIAVTGTDGAFSIVTGVDRPAALTGNEGTDFPKAGKEWYAINGSTITGMTADGKSINFEYVAPENQG